MIKTIRSEIINRIDLHVDMIQEGIQETINSPDSSPADFEESAFDLRKIRDLRGLQKTLKEFTNPVGIESRALMMSVIEEMLDMDI